VCCWLVHRTVNSSCPVHRTVNSNLSDAQDSEYLLCPVHRTVNSNLSGAPTASSSREGNCQSHLLQSSAPATREGWELPNEAPTAPRPLETIKGTPRRLQQAHKSSQEVHTSLGSILSLPLLCISLVCVKAKL
jgi:hypothetical protein